MSLLKILAALLLGIAILMPRGAAAQDPFSASFAIAGAVANGIETEKTHNWQRATTDQLQQIIDYEKAILADLQQLRIDIRKIVYEQFQTDAEYELRSDVDQLGDDLAGQKKNDYSDDQRRIERQTEKVESYGPAAYPDAFVGNLALTILYVLTGDTPRRKRYLARQAEVFRSWLGTDDGYPRSVKTKALASIASDIALVNYYKHYVFQNWLGPTIPNGIQGDLESGFQVHCDSEAHHMPPYACRIWAEPILLNTINPILNAASTRYKHNKQVVMRMDTMLGQIRDYCDKILTWSRRQKLSPGMPRAYCVQTARR